MAPHLRLQHSRSNVPQKDNISGNAKPRMFKSNRNLCFVFVAVALILFLGSTYTEPCVVVEKSTMASARKEGIKDGLRFVIYLGLEGTGHHFWRDIVGSSPQYQALNSTTDDLIPRFSERLALQLYHKKDRREGLFSSICPNKPGASDIPNVSQLQNRVAETLRSMAAYAATNHNTTTTTPLVYPINMIIDKRMGTLSYPSHLVKNCRQMNYPNVDVWFGACAKANVNCEMVYMHRDPYAIIRSTTFLRRYNVDAIHAIHLYTTMLYVLQGQMKSHQNRVAGCLDYDAAAKVASGQQSAVDDYLDVSLLGYADQSEYKAALKSHFVPKKPMTEADRRSVVPLQLEPYMKSMVEMHNSNVRLCKDLVKLRSA